MKHMPLALVAVALTASLATPFVQERVSEREKPTFAETHEALAESWTNQKYSRALAQAQDLMLLVQEKRREVILAAFPAAPSGWEVEADERNPNAENPFLAAMAMGMGSVIDQRYRQTGGRNSLHVTVTADSPLVQMFGMWIANPQMLGPDAELIRYGEIQAILKKEGSSWLLQILIDANLVEARVTGEDDEWLLGRMSQAVVDRLAAALRQ